MTRSMFVTVLCRLTGAELDYDGTSEFTDVPSDAWYAPYVAWATKNGIVTGYGDGRFGPEEPVSREQMCVLIQRLLAEEKRKSRCRRCSSASALCFYPGARLRQRVTSNPPVPVTPPAAVRAA